MVESDVIYSAAQNTAYSVSSGSSVAFESTHSILYTYY